MGLISSALDDKFLRSRPSALPSCSMSGKAYLWELPITLQLRKSPAVTSSSHNAGFLLDRTGYTRRISKPTLNVAVYVIELN